MPEYKFVNSSEALELQLRGVTFDNNTELQPQISTDGAELIPSTHEPLTIVPGEQHDHGVTVTDDLNHIVNAPFRAAIFTKKAEDGNFEFNHTFSPFISGDKIQVKGEPKSVNQNVTLQLSIVSPRQSLIRLNVTLLDCPPGFIFINNSECVCNEDAYEGIFKCDLDNFRSHLNLGYWAGFIDGSKLVTSSCPFCDYNLSSTSNTFVLLPRHRSELNKAVCGETRTGIACGRCQDEYTVHFHSPEFMCKPAEPAGCRFGWLFYILSELVPLTLVFITVLVFNISFTSGSVNGFILFSQLLGSLDIDASGIIVFPDAAKHKIKYVTQGYQVIYGFLNLDFFNSEHLSFCLWKNASALDMLAFKYITILYTVLLVVTVIWIMNKCGGRCLGKFCRITAIKTSIVHGISTFLVISYAQCVKVSLSLLLRVHIHAEQGSDSPHTRAWFNGELVYFSKEHLPYALPALFCLLTVGLLPPFLLLTYPLLNKVLSLLGLENHTVINLISGVLPVSSLKPLLDSFQGCFKDNMRFFAGLYFLYRWSFLVIHLNTGDFSAYYTTVGGFLLFILTLHTICQPYIKREHNIIDALLFANLVLINSLSSFNFHKSNSPISRATVSPAIVQLMLIYLPVIVVGVCLFVTICKYIVSHGYRNQTVANSFIPERAVKLRELLRTISSQNESSDSSEEEFTHNRLMDEHVEYSTMYIEGT